MTNPLTNIAGVYKINNRRISFDTGFTDDMINMIIDKFSKSKKTFRMGEYIVLPSWPKHQNWDSKSNIKAGIDKILNSLSDNELTFLYQIEYKYPILEILTQRGVKPPTNPVAPPRNQDEPTQTPQEPHYSILSNSNLSNLNLNSQKPKPENSESSQVPPENQSLSTADAVVVENHDDLPDVLPPETALIPVKKPDKTSITFSPVDSPPKKRKTLELTPEQKLLYQAAKECFESSERARAIIYQDSKSAKMQMESLKNIVVRCCNLAPGITVDFLKSVLEHFRVMTNNAKYKGSWVFTPRCLSTHWIWEIVINSLPERETEMDKNIRESIKGLFKKR
jgi:hypothetical protein